jgi:hypothetical protein
MEQLLDEYDSVMDFESPQTPTKKPNILVPDSKIITGKNLLDSAFNTLSEMDNLEGMRLVIGSISALRTTEFFQEQFIRVSDVPTVSAQEPTKPAESPADKRKRELEAFVKYQEKVSCKFVKLDCVDCMFDYRNQNLTI